MAETLLIVDDEKSVLSAWKRALKYSGYNVESASSAEEALDLVKQRGFDLVILDYIMPGMTGLELLYEIRRHIPTIRSIIVSGKLDTSVDENQIASDLKDKLECDIYLHKPIDNQKLRRAVGELIKGVEDEWGAIADHVLNSRKKKKEIKKAERKLKNIQNRYKKTN